MIKKKLDIIYEDKYLLVVSKPAGLLTIATLKDDRSLYYEVRDYLNKKNQKAFIVHRLDKDTSGLVVFAKSEKVKIILQNNWHDVKRGYVALVHGKLERNKDTIKSYLKETKTLLVYSTNDSKNGKLAITEYEVISKNNKYSLLDINILTGRKNQIRVHLNDINHPIVGDKKYSNIKDKSKRLYLHANYLEFNHPITNEILKLNTIIPKEFNSIIKGID